MQAWDNFLALQEAELGKDVVQKWLRPLRILRFDACNLYLEAKDSFQALWFEEHVRSKIIQKFVNNNNKRIRVHLAVANAPQKSKVKTKTTTQPPAAPLKFNLSFDQLDPNCTFNQFVQTEPNALTYRLLSQLGENPVELGTFNPIYIHGRSGTGKTHLMMATVHALREKGLNVLYCRAETFTEHVVTAIRAGEMSVFRQAYRNIDVLCIDDVHVFSRKGATQEEFFHTFNTLHLDNKQIILSANCAPGELQLIEPRLISRFEWGIVVPLEVVEKDNISKILQKKAEAFRFPLPPKVAAFLLETFTSSTKALTRAIEALILRTHLQESSSRSIVQLTVQSARHQLEDLIHEEERTALTPSKVVQAVAEQFGIKPEDILSRAQSRDCVIPRQVAMYIMRNELKLPYMRIGEIFEKDHSTVMSSVRVIQKEMEMNERDLSNTVNAIIKKLH